MTTSPMTGRFREVPLLPITPERVRAAALTVVETLSAGGANRTEARETLTAPGIGAPELRRGMFYEGSTTSTTVRRGES